MYNGHCVPLYHVYFSGYLTNIYPTGRLPEILPENGAKMGMEGTDVYVYMYVYIVYMYVCIYTRVCLCIHRPTHRLKCIIHIQSWDLGFVLCIIGAYHVYWLIHRARLVDHTEGCRFRHKLRCFVSTFL